MTLSVLSSLAVVGIEAAKVAAVTVLGVMVVLSVGVWGLRRVEALLVQRSEGGSLPLIDEDFIAESGVSFEEWSSAQGFASDDLPEIDYDFQRGT